MHSIYKVREKYIPLRILEYIKHKYKVKYLLKIQVLKFISNISIAD